MSKQEPIDLLKTLPNPSKCPACGKIIYIKDDMSDWGCSDGKCIYGKGFMQVMKTSFRSYLENEYLNGNRSRG